MTILLLLSVIVSGSAQGADRLQALRSEMRSSLYALYAAEKAFFVEAGRYSTDLRAIGFEPASGKMGVRVGFLSAFEPEKRVAGEDPRAMSSDSFLDRKRSYLPSAKRVRWEKISGFCYRGCTADEERFEAIAVARTPSGDYEVMRINHFKELETLTD